MQGWYSTFGNASSGNGQITIQDRDGSDPSVAVFDVLVHKRLVMTNGKLA